MNPKVSPSPEDLLEDLARAIRACTRCGLHRTRTQAVPGEGPASARVMLVGEAPGFHEDRTGRPFVGAAGRFLDRLLGLAGLARKQVFITNIVKCRPPRNRDPKPEEVDACSPYLERQLALLDPAVVVTLGRFAMAYFLPQVRISQVHGRAFRLGSRWLVPMYHPAAGLYREALRPVIEADFRQLGQFLQQWGLATFEKGATAPEET